MHESYTIRGRVNAAVASHVKQACVQLKRLPVDKFFRAQPSAFAILAEGISYLESMISRRQKQGYVR